MRDQFYDIRETFNDTTVPFLERVKLANQKLVALGGSELAVKSKFNACILQLSEKRESGFEDRPPFKEDIYDISNPFLRNNSGWSDRKMYAKRMLDHAMDEDVLLKRNVEHSHPRYQPFTKDRPDISWQPTGVDSIDPHIFT